jgi:hypothetical protein
MGRLLAINRVFVGNKMMVCWQQTFMRLCASGNQLIAIGVFGDNFCLAIL